MPRHTTVESVRTDVNQDIFWKDRAGVIHFIDDMDERYRANCARLLIDRAAAMHVRMRRSQIWNAWISYEAAGWEAFARGSWGPVDANETPTYESSIRQIRKEQDRGDHLTWMRTRPMFIRLVRDIEQLLSPGVL